MPNYRYPIDSKLPETTTTIFTKMSALAAKTGAVNLSQGFPDFSPAEELVDLVHKYMREGKNQYAPMGGVPLLTAKLAQKAAQLYSAELDPATEITITAGATQAIFTAITAMVQAGDEVILFDPAYDCYAPAISLCGGVAVRLQLHYPDFAYDWDLVTSKLTERTRMIIINSPHNPSGTSMTASDLEALEAITEGTPICILSDEVYEHILYDGLEHQSVLGRPALAARSFVVNSFGKTYHNTGWKVGYCMAPATLMAEFRKVHQFNVFSVNAPVQFAFADWLDEEAAYLGLGNFYQQKRDHFVSLMAGSRFQLRPSTGTYFQLADYSAITDVVDTDFAVQLTEKYGVATIPVSVFYDKAPPGQRILRFCFAKGNETLERAAEKLAKI